MAGRPAGLDLQGSTRHYAVDGCPLSCKQQVGGSSPSASSGTARSGCWRARLGSPPASPPLERATQPWCVAVLRRLRVESRASGEASSVMAGAEVGGWSVLGRGCLGAGVERRWVWWALGPVDNRSVRTASSSGRHDRPRRMSSLSWSTISRSIPGAGTAGGSGRMTGPDG